MLRVPQDIDAVQQLDITGPPAGWAAVSSARQASLLRPSITAPRPAASQLVLTYALHRSDGLELPLALLGPFHLWYWRGQEAHHAPSVDDARSAPSVQSRLLMDSAKLASPRPTGPKLNSSTCRAREQRPL
jgi:hypothetical protein